MKTNDTYCSHTAVERYLLNLMSREEEALFQQHLEECEDCRRYAGEIRRLAGLLAEKPLWSHAGATDASPDLLKNKPATGAGRRRLPAMLPWLSAAACVLVAGGIAFHRLRPASGELYETHIEYRSRAAIEYADTSWTLLAPVQLLTTIDPAEEPLVFRWNGERAYRLQLESNGRTVADVDGFGSSHTFPSEQAIRHVVLDWTLRIEGKEVKGRLFIQTK